jgi:DnaJ-class molecular chaperone
MTTDWRLYEMLTKDTWRPGDEPLPPSCKVCGGTGRNRPPGLKMSGWGEVCPKCRGLGISDEDDREDGGTS